MKVASKTEYIERITQYKLYIDDTISQDLNELNKINSDKCLKEDSQRHSPPVATAERGRRWQIACAEQECLLSGRHPKRGQSIY